MRGSLPLPHLHSVPEPGSHILSTQRGAAGVRVSPYPISCIPSEGREAPLSQPRRPQSSPQVPRQSTSTFMHPAASTSLCHGAEPRHFTSHQPTLLIPWLIKPWLLHPKHLGGDAALGCSMAASNPLTLAGKEQGRVQSPAHYNREVMQPCQQLGSRGSCLAY